MPQDEYQFGISVDTHTGKATAHLFRVEGENCPELNVTWETPYWFVPGKSNQFRQKWTPDTKNAHLVDRCFCVGPQQLFCDDSDPIAYIVRLEGFAGKQQSVIIDPATMVTSPYAVWDFDMVNVSVPVRSRYNPDTDTVPVVWDAGWRNSCRDYYGRRTYGESQHPFASIQEMDIEVYVTHGQFDFSPSFATRVAICTTGAPVIHSYDYNDVIAAYPELATGRYIAFTGELVADAIGLFRWGRSHVSPSDVPISQATLLYQSDPIPLNGMSPGEAEEAITQYLFSPIRAHYLGVSVKTADSYSILNPYFYAYHRSANFTRPDTLTLFPAT